MYVYIYIYIYIHVYIHTYVTITIIISSSSSNSFVLQQALLKLRRRTGAAKSARSRKQDEMCVPREGSESRWELYSTAKPSAAQRSAAQRSVSKRHTTYTVHAVRAK